jgi:hypothetical protein
MPVVPLVASELMLPASDTCQKQVRSLLAGEGLIPRMSGERTRFRPDRPMRPNDLATSASRVPQAHRLCGRENVTSACHHRRIQRPTPALSNAVSR